MRATSSIGLTLLILINLESMASEKAEIIEATKEEQVARFADEGAVMHYGTYYTHQAFDEIKANGGEGKILTYVQPDRPNHELSMNILNMVAPYVLVTKAPNFNPSANLPFINNKVFNSLFKKRISEGVKVFVTGVDKIGGAAVLSDNTPFNDFLGPERSSPIIIVPIKMGADTFAHEDYHLGQRDRNEMDLIEAKIYALLDELKGEKVPYSASQVLNHIYNALKEVPACIEQASFIQQIGKQQDRVNTLSFTTPKFDQSTGALIESASSSTVFYTKKTVPFAEYRVSADKVVKEYLDRLYLPIERALSYIKDEGNRSAIGKICQFLEKEIASGTVGSPQKFLPTCEYK